VKNSFDEIREQADLAHREFDELVKEAQQAYKDFRNVVRSISEGRVALTPLVHVRAGDTITFSVDTMNDWWVDVTEVTDDDTHVVLDYDGEPPSLKGGRWPKNRCVLRIVKS